jgi:soluble lytic murein transglycosylase
VLSLPAFPLQDPSPDDLLAAMGLYDDLVPKIADRYPLSPLDSGLTRAVAYRLASASRPSIGTAETLMGSVPDDYLPQLLPRELRELLYPRYYYDRIASAARANGVDPRLLLAIMREESRFNPRAKSGAAARGLMQLLLSTARQVGESLGLVEVSSEDLYDPQLVIRLGAKYLGDLLERFDGDPYAATAAYNAGPAQARLWRELQPAPGDDYYLSTVSFGETKSYLRKVLNSYERYGEIYQGQPATGGTRAEP